MTRQELYLKRDIELTREALKRNLPKSPYWSPPQNVKK